MVVGKLEAPGADFLELFLVVSHAPTGASHGVGRPNDDRKAELALDLPGLFHGMGTLALGHSRPMRFIAWSKRSRSSAMLMASALAPIISTPCLASTPCLSSSRAQLSAVCPPWSAGWHRAARLDDLLHRLPGDRLDVGGVGHHRIGHDGRWIGVDQNDPEAFLAQGLAGLGAGIVEFAGLADDDGACADDQDALDVGTFGHGASRKSGDGRGATIDRVRASASTPHHVDETVEQRRHVPGAGARLGVSLKTECRPVGALDTLQVPSNRER